MVSFKSLNKKFLRTLHLDHIAISKRQRFVISVIILSLGLFLSEHLFGKGGFYLVIILSILSDLLFLLSMLGDIRGNLSLQVMILPFLYTLSFGLFYFLVPYRFLTRIAMTSLYAVGLYSLFLSQNIFVVASIRNIALLSGARIVSFVITLISYFFLSTIVFSLDLHILPTSVLLFIFSFLLILQSIWTITLDNSVKSSLLWVLALSLCLFEISLILWFWPATPALIALFLTGFFYTAVGLSHTWFDKRLFKGVMWEYIWVAVIVFCILILFTSWKG